MKQIQRVTLFVFALCALCLPATAQRNNGGQRQWRYEGSDGQGYITIIITERLYGSALRYEISGDYRSAFPCTISGTYLPEGERMRAVCKGTGRSPMNVTGTLIAEDEVSIEIGANNTHIKRVGEGPSLPTGGLTGIWRIEQTGADGARYSGMLEIKQSGSQLTGRAVWENHQSGEISGSVQGEAVKFTVAYGGGLVGTYEARRNGADRSALNGTAFSNKGGGTVNWKAIRRQTTG